MRTAHDLTSVVGPNANETWGGARAAVMVMAGFVLIMIARDYDQGLAAVNRGRELNPNIAFVSFLGGQR